MPLIELPQVTVRYEDSGGDGAAILFSHGIFMDHEMWAPQVASLRSEFRCVAYDERGHGDSVASGSWSYWDMANDAVALLDHLGIDHAFFVGMSQGGFLSLRAALTAPERVRGLVLVDSQAGVEDPAHLPGYEAMVQQWSTKGPSVSLGEASAAIILGPADHEPWIGKWMTKPNDYPVEPMKTLTSRGDIHDRLPEIACPALVIHGEIDAAIPMERAEALCAGLSGCEGVLRIEGAGHAANLSHPGIVTEAIRDFCRRHAG